MSRNHDRHGQHVYGAVHQKERKRWIRRVRAGGGGVLALRRSDPSPGAWDLGHVDEDGRRRGYPLRHPEHVSCNRATVAHLKQKLADQEVQRW